MNRKLSLVSAAAGVLAAVVSAPVAAQATWNYATFSQAATNANNFGNSYSSTQSGTTLTVRSYSTTGSGATFANANIGNFGTGSGFGVRNTVEGLAAASPNHAMDNASHLDVLALSFSSPVVVTSLTTGWSSTDSDISLLRWGGAGTPAITGKTTAQLLSDGWQLVDHYANMVDDVSRATGLNSGSANSSWWLISAYSSSWGGASLTDGNDFVKVLASVTALPSGNLTPEPGSMALAGAAGLGLMALRRRRARRG